MNVNAYPVYRVAQNAYYPAGKQQIRFAPSSAPVQKEPSQVGNYVKWGAIIAATAGAATLLLKPDLLDGVRDKASQLVTNPVGAVKDMVTAPLQGVLGLLNKLNPFAGKAA